MSLFSNTLQDNKEKDKEKLGTKAVAEEFHGINHGDGTYTFKLLYGWNSLNTNVWLPSLIELVGMSGVQNATYGTFNSAMQGLNTSNNYYVDAQGGTQFAYFKPYNASAGGEKAWAACNQQQSWLRSVRMDNSTHGWMMLNATYFHTPAATDSYAVHPAVLKTVSTPTQAAIENTGKS